MAHSNPIIPGFSPDPSICLIDGTFFLVNSSFHLFPGLPVYMSNDLVSWTHIGNAISRRSQLSLTRATTFLDPWDDGTTLVATGGLYAPTIRHHNGTTYIICTNVIHGASNLPGDERNEQFIIHTSDIRSGNWSDPIVFDEPGIDPSLLFDDHRVYVQLCKVGPEFQIFNMEIDLDSGTVITQPTLIWQGWRRGFTEGPHIYKKDGWYYLLCAEGGTFQNHMLSIARSRDVWGPYEHCPGNPLYTAHGTDRYIQNTGHGDIFQDQAGKWWVVLLGIRLKEGRSFMGRETFLAAVDWPDNEWPVVQAPNQSEDSETRPILLENQESAVHWVCLRDAKMERYHINGSSVTLQADTVDLTSADMSVAFVGQRQRKLHGTATVKLYRPLSATSLQAGLCLYKDEHRFLAIDYDFGAQQVHFEALNRAKSISHKQSHDVSFQSLMSFKIDYTETSLKFSFCADQGDWQFASEFDTSDWTDNDFTGPVIGVFGIGKNVMVDFGGFEIDS
ncbi:Concanavalin A-like lectin/glucanase subgroup [Penicillium brevicompactum]|uniref:Concanavalin A-like lectin/glucanase subgroup n=1 Tax=Penicillium brevicompactum TaxID=5074 RepID=A0A9W9QV46_PENBR|nr:Concanavalin A-like lectin/glucanase subgroup [Penicillium brevicompactum]